LANSGHSIRRRGRKYKSEPSDLGRLCQMEAKRLEVRLKLSALKRGLGNRRKGRGDQKAEVKSWRSYPEKGEKESYQERVAGSCF